MPTTEIFLGLIALATLTNATLHVAVVVVIWRAARGGTEVMRRLEHQMQPIIENLHLVSADAAKASAMAVGHAQRLDEAVRGLSSRMEGLIGLATAIARPAGRLSLVLAAARLLRSVRRRRRSRPQAETHTTP